MARVPRLSPPAVRCKPPAPDRRPRFADPFHDREELRGAGAPLSLQDHGRYGRGANHQDTGFEPGGMVSSSLRSGGAAATFGGSRATRTAVPPPALGTPTADVGPIGRIGGQVNASAGTADRSSSAVARVSGRPATGRSPAGSSARGR